MTPERADQVELKILPNMFGIMRKGEQYNGNEMFKFDGMKNVNFR